jgi:hypothetical protein
MNRRDLLKSLSAAGVLFCGTTSVSSAVTTPQSSVFVHQRGHLKCLGDALACEFHDFGHRAGLTTTSGSYHDLAGPESDPITRRQTRYVDAAADDNSVTLLDHGNLRLRHFSRSGDHLEDRELSQWVRSPQSLVADENGFWISDSQAHQLLHLTSRGRIDRRIGPEMNLHGPGALARSSLGDIHVLCPAEGQIRILDHKGRTRGSYGHSVVGPGARWLNLRHDDEAVLLDRWSNMVLSGGPGKRWSMWLTPGERHRVRLQALSVTHRDDLVVSL